jgi:hypothetical protein
MRKMLEDQAKLEE